MRRSHRPLTYVAPREEALDNKELTFGFRASGRKRLYYPLPFNPLWPRHERLRAIPFLSHCRGCVFPVRREVLANEDSQLCAATKYEKRACELCDQRISRAIFLRIM